MFYNIFYKKFYVLSCITKQAENSKRINQTSSRNRQPTERGKYKYPVDDLNNMNLTYEKILAEALLFPKRLNKRFNVVDLRDQTQIGVFARQTLADEIKK